MCQKQEQSFPCDAAATAGLRRSCVQWLADSLGSTSAAAACTDAASLVISELVANAVNAGCARAAVIVELHRHRARVAVTDDGPGLPRIQQPTAIEGHGRGLQIVERLSLAWGVSPTPTGKTVWAELAVPADLTVDVHCELADSE